MTSLDNLILCPATRRQLEDYLIKPTHALMLTGEVGAGLGTIARTLAKIIAGANVVNLQPSLHKQQKTSIINVDDIEGIITILRDRRDQNLVVIIDSADQTAPGVFERMLKLIEEPVAGVYYIFTAHDLTNIPTTILSRSSLIKVMLPDSPACQSLYADVDSKTAAQVKFIADRRPALIKRLLDDKDALSGQVGNMELAKRFLQGDLAARLSTIDQISTKEQGVELCTALTQLFLAIASRQVADKAKAAKQLDLLSAAASNLTANGNARLQLIDLVLNYG